MGSSAGRTAGSLYALSTVGSIAGTFAAGAVVRLGGLISLLVVTHPHIDHTRGVEAVLEFQVEIEGIRVNGVAPSLRG